MKRKSIVAVPFGVLLAALLAGGDAAHAGTLSAVPLFVSSRIDPNVVFNLSIETPMQGAAFNDQNDTASGGGCGGRAANEGGYQIGTCYFKTKAYRGYFDAAKCYSYSTADDRFNPVAGRSYTIGSTATCGGYWSGNFLNWATMTAVDIFRYAVTGGHRSTDSATTTVLQRANQSLGRGDQWFPLKKIGTAVAPGNVDPRTVTPFNANTIYVHNHGTQLDAGTSTATSSKGFTNRYVRAKVCDPSAGLEANCTQYGTSYKPTGLIQNNAERMRFAVTSFLRDNDQRRDGGVLRAKAKYVGPRKFVPGSGDGSGWVENPAAEWSGSNGSFIANPDSGDATASGVANSGVINYINKFGGSGYKSYDPAGELYYETLRYLMGDGRSPTSSYVSGSWDGSGTLAANDAKMDGFPVILDWDDPYRWATRSDGVAATAKYSCQKSFVVGINDANPWLDKRLPGTHFTTATITKGDGGTLTLLAGDYGAPPGAETGIDVRTLTNRVGELEGLNNTTWSSSGSWTSAGTTSTATGSNDSVGGGPGTYSTSCGSSRAVAGLGEIMGTCPYTPKENSYYIAGLAYFANTEDLRGDIDERQSVATYMIDTQEYSSNPLDGPKNMLWLAGKYGGFVDSNADGNPNASTTGAATRDEWDKDGDGIPDNYVFASQPDKLISGLTNAFDDIFARTSSASSVATNTGFLSTSGKIYQARFNSGDWSGDLAAYGITAGTGAIAATADWSAGARVTAQAEASRVIVTRKTSAGTAQAGGARRGGGVSFNWPVNPASPGAGELDLSQTDALRLKPGQAFATGETCATAAAKCDPTAVGAARLAYLRGDRSNEGTSGYGFRRRLNGVLGDIVNSNPVFVGAPADGHLDPTYMGFRAANVARRKMIYVGANDGMLHGFDAGNGNEAIAFVPTTAYAALSRLTLSGYGTASLAHSWFVDGTPMVADICTAMSTDAGNERNCSAASAWKTRLYGGLNGGGRGIFALDVTNPSAGNFTAGNAASIVKWEFTADQDADLGYTYSQPQVKKIRTGAATWVWAVVFGSGYKGSNGKSVLWILNADSGALIAKLVLADDSAQTYPQGLATVAAIDSDGDNVADAIYAGDLRGNLWKVRQKGGNGANAYDWWVYNRAGAAGVPLFVAQDAAATPNRQPITVAPDVMRHPKKRGLLIFFGTGKYLEDNDQATVGTQSIYGIWDDESNDPIPAARGDDYLLAQQTVQAVVAANSQSFRIVSNNAVDWTTRRGWYLDLPDSGERVVNDPAIFAGRILVPTLVPSSDPCSFGGTSWLMELNPETGGELGFAPFDVDGNGAINGLDLIDFDGSKRAAGGRKSEVGIVNPPTIITRQTSGGGQLEGKYLSGSSGTMEKVDNNPGPGITGRVSWRQIFAE